MNFLTNHRLRWILAPVCALMIFCVALTPVAATAQVQKISLSDNQMSRVVMASGVTLNIETDGPFAEILIGNTEVLDVFPISSTSLYIQSKRSGNTNITLYSQSKELLEVIDVLVRTDFSEVNRVIQSAVPSARVEVDNLNNRIRLSGLVKDNLDLRRVLEIARQYSSEPVINGIIVESAQQVELDVRILEVERNSGRNLGVDLLARRGTNEIFETTGAARNDINGPFGLAVGELLEVSGTNIDFVINALETRGLARRLANPKLVTTSGIEANFVVGGEVPINTSSRDASGNLSSSTSYREYGVRLNFTPQVLDDELIRLRIAPEVSDIDPSVNVNGQPGFISRKAETTVLLRNGQSFAIAGLLQSNNARGSDQVPWLGQLPVIGALFSSREFQKRETDLVILVTPRLVQPATPDTPLSSPLDETVPSNDVELFLLGMLEVDNQLLTRFREGRGAPGPYGHIIELEFEDGIIKK